MAIVSLCLACVAFVWAVSLTTDWTMDPAGWPKEVDGRD